MAITPNMLLDLPTPGPGGTPGPTWASDLNTALNLVDTHDHTSSKGVKVPSAGLNIDADLTFAQNNATELRTVRFADQGAEPTGASDTGIVYTKNGELFYRDSSAQEVQITSGGSVAGATGTITGLMSPASASYSVVAKSFTFNQDSSKPGKLNISDILVYEFDDAAALPVTIATSGVTASHTMILPTAGAAGVELLNIDGSGQMNHAVLSGTTNQVNISQSATAITLSTPQNIHTGAAPTFAGMDLTGNLDMNDATVTNAARVRAGDGLVTNPAFLFEDDQDTGIYRSGDNEVAIACGGNQRLRVTDGTVVVEANVDMQSNNIIDTGDIACEDISCTSVTSTGEVEASEFTVGSSTIKWTKFTGSLGPGASTDLNVTGAVFGAVGYQGSDGSFSFGTKVVSLRHSGVGDQQIYFELSPTADSDTVKLVSTAGLSTLHYRVIVWHE